MNRGLLRGLTGAPTPVNMVLSGPAMTIPPTTPPVMGFSVITLTSNCVLSFPAGAVGATMQIMLVQDGTGSRTVTWPVAVKWPAGTAPTLTTTAGKTDLFEFQCADGVTWLGRSLGLNY